MKRLRIVALALTVLSTSLAAQNVARNADGKAVRDPREVSVGTRIVTEWTAGRLTSRVEE